MTEEQAKNMVCPIRCGWYVGRSTMNSEIKAYCIGSECMMWRVRFSPEEEMSEQASIDGSYHADGYCGLGGKP